MRLRDDIRCADVLVRRAPGAVWRGALLACSIACSSREEHPRAVSSAAAPMSSAVGSAGPFRRTRPAGTNPFAFPARPLAAAAGSYALVPSRSGIEAAFERPGPHTFVYLGAFIEQPGEFDSRIRWLSQQRGLVSNALVIPIRPNERASVGAVVLTSWAAGSGLQRAIIVPGGSAESPRVRYLDVAANSAIAVAQPTDTLPPDTFHTLSTPGEIGSSVACRVEQRVERLIVTNTEAGRVLGLGFAGRMRVVELARCKPMPIVPQVRIGERVHVPVLGDFIEARVTRLEPEHGRVWAAYEFGNEQRTESFGYTNVAVELP